MSPNAAMAKVHRVRIFILVGIAGLWQTAANEIVSLVELEFVEGQALPKFQNDVPDPEDTHPRALPLIKVAVCILHFRFGWNHS